MSVSSFSHHLGITLKCRLDSVDLSVSWDSKRAPVTLNCPTHWTMRALQVQVGGWLGSLKCSQYNELCNSCSELLCNLNYLSYFALEFTRSYHTMQGHQLLPFILLSIPDSCSQLKDMWDYKSSVDHCSFAHLEKNVEHFLCSRNYARL